MAFCSKCGTQVADDAAFCSNCGQAMKADVPAYAASQGGSTGMAENVAGFLCYVLGWLTGLIFFLIDKRPFVRFHAAQSIVVFGGLQLVNIVLRRFFIASFVMGGFGAMSLGGLLILLVNLLTL